jgi:Trk K+ transport system NAD-binding subunit
VVCADTEFGDELVRDLIASGLTVDLADPADGELDVSGAVGFIAGTSNDTTNIALAEQARLANPDVYLVVRQQTNTKKALLDALQIDSVYIATELVAREVLARTLTPVFWSFVEHAFGRDEAWATRVRDHLQESCGRHTPSRDVIVLSPERAPAIAEWLRRGETLTVADLIRRPDDRDARLPLAALVVLRDGAPVFMPGPDTILALGDQVLLVGNPDGLAQVREIRHYPTTVEYLATGRDVPLTWVWARLTGLTRRRDGAARPH